VTDDLTGRPLWAGRFSVPPAAEAFELGASVSFDRRLAAEDVEASAAHVAALRDAGVVSTSDASVLLDGLRALGAEIVRGSFVLRDDDEDVHSAVERTLTERLGSVGERLHAARSRNDLVATDLRLWLLASEARVDAHLTRLLRTLIALARAHAETVIPGLTHGRLAQPVTLGHHLMAHAWALMRDRERLAQWSRRTSVCPLGAGALATSTLPLDPAATATRLGFDRAFDNSIDAVSDRDFVLEFCAVCAIVGMHASRLAGDVARWVDEAVGWAELGEEYSTGSSMMPQKRNPDTVELARAKAARPASDFVRLAAVLQGLPLGYHRDLQEDKEAAFDAGDTLERTLPALAGAVESLRFAPEAMRAAASDDELFATDIAEALVGAGLPFREAHRRTGALLRDLVRAGRGLRDLSADEWAAFGVADGAARLDADRSVRARSTSGGPAPASVRAQADAAERTLDAR
jgi:argininosuccinate lyase